MDQTRVAKKSFESKPEDRKLWDGPERYGRKMQRMIYENRKASTRQECVCVRKEASVLRGRVSGWVRVSSHQTVWNSEYHVLFVGSRFVSWSGNRSFWFTVLYFLPPPLLALAHILGIVHPRFFFQTTVFQKLVLFLFSGDRIKQIIAWDFEFLSDLVTWRRKQN
jgi:hypothetical protein